MKLSAQHLTSDSQWQAYQQLELIPAFIPNPTSQANPLASALNYLWRPFLGLLIDELVEEQRVEYLDRCWALNGLDEKEQSASISLHRFWVLMN